MNFVNAFKFGDFEDTFVGVFYKTINIFLEPIGFSRKVFYNWKVRKTLAIYDQQFLKEQNIFGTSRLGTYKTTQKTKGERQVCDAEEAGKVIFGNRTYEMTNHLGNVMATVSDRVNKENGAFDAVVISAQDYYPYGLMMEGRSYSNGENSYSFGFQGQEEDGETSLVNYKYRMHNPRIGKFFAVDPLSPDYPELTPYQFASNSPIAFKEIEGLEGQYYVVNLNSEEPKLKFNKTVDYWLIPNSIETDYVVVEVPGPKGSYISYMFTGVAGDCPGCGTGNYIGDFDKFQEDPLGSIYSGQYRSDQEILGDMVKEAALAYLMGSCKNSGSFKGQCAKNPC